jgi:purine-binding chemotaxis protein CheW
MIEEFKDLKEVQMIIFRLGKEEYAVPILGVQEIIMRQSPTHIPKSPSWAEGVINLRGHIIPVIDGKKKFCISETVSSGNDERIMVLDVNNEIIGLIVDEVSEVIHLKTENIEPPPIDVDDDSDFLWGIARHQNWLLILINPQKFLSHKEALDIKKLVKVSESMQQSEEDQVEEGVEVQL